MKVVLYENRQFHCIHKNKLYLLHKMLELNLILQIMDQIQHWLKTKIKKVIGLMKDELGRKIIKNLFGLREKTYSYLIDDGSKDKKPQGTKNV